MSELMLLAARLLLLGAIVISPIIDVHARFKPEYASAPQAVQDWYHAAELTPAAQKRFPFKSCCEHADVVRSQFRVSHSANAEDEWYYMKDGAWVRIPPDIIHWGEHAPDGQPTLFAYLGKETCFWPADGGI